MACFISRSDRMGMGRMRNYSSPHAHLACLNICISLVKKQDADSDNFARNHYSEMSPLLHDDLMVFGSLSVLILCEYRTRLHASTKLHWETCQAVGAFVDVLTSVNTD
jgi:hypothetical protein